jgi:phthalate 4,5-dioxygenase oxygenase subunit
MLTREENELLTRIGSDTPMGKLMRRYWIPALMSDEIEAGGDPKRVSLLGEDLVAFRDANGNAGLLDEHCPHRGASLALARSEGCALRCLYHGWLIDRHGTVLETPAEPDEFGFKNKVKAAGYPTREAGGMIWTYLGPAGLEPELQDFEFCSMPLEHVEILKVRVDCNWAQVIEGVIDSSHSSYLHGDSVRYIENASEATVYAPDMRLDRPSIDGRPKIDVKTTDYGFRYAAIRDPILDSDKNAYIRVTLWMPPFYGMFPAPKGWGNMQAMVPIDDTATMFYYFKYSYDAPISPAERLEHAKWSGVEMGVDVLDAHTYAKRQNRENMWMQDRAKMRAGESLTGISGVNQQDFAVEESMGRVYDRTKEHLGAGDAAVIRMRRSIIDAARAVERGEPPLALGKSVPWSRLRAEEGTIPRSVAWETVLSTAGDEALEPAAGFGS